MKKLIWIALVLIFTCIFHTCNGQVNIDAQVTREVLRATHFEDLTDDEKWLLLEKVSEAYYTFNKKEINQSTLLIYMEEKNPICEWTGRHFERKEKMIRYYSVHRKYILEIFDL